MSSEIGVMQVFQCRFCYFCTCSRSNIREHEASHTEEQSEDENSNVSSPESPESSGEEEKFFAFRFLCPYCSFGFDRKDKMVNHIRTHTGEKPFKCNYCPKTFARKDNRLKHMVVHERGGRLHRISGKTPDSKKIKMEMETKFPMKPFKSFEAQSGHQKSPGNSSEELRNSPGPRNGESKFKCPYCPSTFTARASLNRHSNVHTGEKPFNCPHCSKGFARADYVKLHVRKIHGRRGGSIHQSSTPMKISSNTTSDNEPLSHFPLNPQEPTADTFIQPKLLFSSSMVIHMCDICDFNCTDEIALDRHYKRHAVDDIFRENIC